MWYHAKNGILTFPGNSMEYIRFGTGKKVLIMLPGLGDGLRTMKGTALPMAWMYRMFAKEYTVYAFSRMRYLPEGYTTLDMARDQKRAMDRLGIQKADLMGVSMGGMIAQHLAAEYPESIEKLILVVTSARLNLVLKESVDEWIALAKQGDHTAFMDSNMRRIYRDSYYQKNQWTIPLIGLLTKPKSYERFYVQAEACLTHDAWDRLQAIRAKTLVIGGAEDRCLSGQASEEIASKISNSQIYMYKDFGHGLYEEAKDFNDRVLKFLQQE